MVERAAPRRRAVKPEAANGGGPEGPGFTARWWGQTIELGDQINPHPTAAPPVLRPSVKFSAVFARILTAPNTSLSLSLENYLGCSA